MLVIIYEEHGVIFLNVMSHIYVFLYKLKEIHKRSTVSFTPPPPPTTKTTNTDFNNQHQMLDIQSSWFPVSLIKSVLVLLNNK